MATSKSNVNPNHYKSAGRERQGEDILQTRHKQKHAQSLVRGRFTPHTRAERPALIPGPPPRGAAPVRAAVRTAKTGANTSAKKRNVVKKASTNKQGSDKRGKRSTAQKRASSRHDFGPIPATSPVAGAFGKEPSARRRTSRQG
jgi:hypothetical protein